MSVKKEELIFFANKDNRNKLEIFISSANSVLDILRNKDEKRWDRLTRVKQIIEKINESPKEWDERCSFNINSIGQKFINELASFNSESFGVIDRIYVMAYRFLCELDFLTGAESGPSIDLLKIKGNIQKDTEDMDEQTKSGIIYASYYMPVEIVKRLINHEDIVVFKNFEQKKTEAEDYTKKWTDEFKKTKEETEELKKNLDEYKTAFNFVGLDKGFSNLKESKSKEAKKLCWFLFLMGFCTLGLPCFELYLAISDEYKSMLSGVNHFAILLPLISMEIILIYFFRIVLLNHKSVKAQVMQIELRQTLCQFIQSYADYSVVIKAKDKDALEKFENLIFSGILTNPEKLPSTFDGIEQLTNIIRSVKA